MLGTYFQASKTKFDEILKLMEQLSELPIVQMVPQHSQSPLVGSQH